jgi:small multidrug resistance pump
MTVAVKRIDMSVSYAIWSGVGTALVALIGVFWFRESLTGVQVASIGLIIAGVIGLRAGAAAGAPAPRASCRPARLGCRRRWRPPA